MQAGSSSEGAQAGAWGRRLAELVRHVEQVFSGKRREVELALTCLLAEGHLLLEDLPGLGKTTLAQALARSIGGRFQRIQFTSDLLPADILGISIYSRNQERFEFRPGPIFANVVLADEINRSTPRTQSALLEAMAERKVSLDHTTHELPSPFLVLATQNPLEVHGTYPLPESQLDRFLMRLSLGHPPREVERQLLLARGREEPVLSLPALLEPEELTGMQRQVDGVRLDPSLADLVLQLAGATRSTHLLRGGLSTRATLSWVRAARAHALVRGRGFCLPDDLLELAGPVLAHRLRLRDAGSSRSEAEELLQQLVSRLDVPV